MGKQGAAANDSKVSIDQLKTEGDQLFIKKDFQNAITAYDKALNIASDKDKVDVYTKKAACLLQLKKYKEAVSECSAALAVSPGFRQAIIARSKAYEQQGELDSALADIQTINVSDAATSATKQSEQRLKDLIAKRSETSSSSKTASTGGAGPRLPQREKPTEKSTQVKPTPKPAAELAKPAPKPATEQRAVVNPSNLMPAYFSAKCTFNSDTQLVHLPYAVSYVELLHRVQAKMNITGPFVLKCETRDGRKLTLTSREDITLVLNEALAAHQKALAGHPNFKAVVQSTPPTFRVQVESVAKDADAPTPPPLELLERARALMAEKEKLEAAAKKAEQMNAEAEAQSVGEVDPWLLDMSTVFCDMTGLKAARQTNLQTLGLMRATRAMEATISSDRAVPLFDGAIDKFKEVCALGLMNCGNVHMCVGHKMLDDAANKGDRSKEVINKVISKMVDAKDCFDKSLTYKNNFYDGLMALGQVEFERAKLRAGLVMKQIPPAESEEEGEKTQAAVLEALKEALSHVKADGVKQGQVHMDKAISWFTTAANSAEEPKEGLVDPQTGEPPLHPKKHARIMAGNVIYEWSQVVAAVGGEWRPLLDRATAMFKEAECSDLDIRNALKNHTQVEHIDLGPEPEPEVKKPKAEKEVKKEEKKAPEAKGLPSLDVKKKKADK